MRVPSEQGLEPDRFPGDMDMKAYLFRYDGELEHACPRLLNPDNECERGDYCNVMHISSYPYILQAHVAEDIFIS